MKRLTQDELLQFLKSWETCYDLRLPILLPDGGRAICRLADGPLAMHGGSVPAKPTSLFFPQDGLVFAAGANGYLERVDTEKRLFIIGLTPTDLQCLRFIDRFFSTGERDDLYFASRDKAIIAVVSGYCGRDGEFIPPSSGSCDLELYHDGIDWLLMPYSDEGRELAASFNAGDEVVSLESVHGKAVHPPSAEQEVVLAAAAILQETELPDAFWDEIGEHCIQCSGCNLTCPTCTCFGVQDWCYGEHTERRRVWDSCQLAGFMREAGGHNPLATAGQRSRRRIHHKLVADMARWGEIGCFVCGRCDLACPTGIGIIAVSREIVTRFGMPDDNSKRD